jgi:hypothetical protein
MDNLMQNGPELWAEVLRVVKKTTGREAIIAGGAIRDYLIGAEPKDIDVFVECNGACDYGDIVDPRFKLLPVPADRDDEYKGQSGRVQFVQEYEFAGHTVQLVYCRLQPFTGEALMDDFDFNITKSWFDGALHDTAAAEADRRLSTITVVKRVGMLRTEKRAARFMDRHPGRFTLVEQVAA